MIFQVVALPGTASQNSTVSTSYVPMFLFIGLLIAVFVAAIFIIKRKRYDDGLDRKKILETWTEIQKTSGMGLMGMKLAVIEADKLVDNVMRQLLIPGETMGDRLKMAEFKYPDIRKVWPAHKTRNMLVHDSTYQLTMRAGKEALRDFEKALKLLKAL